ncbi:diacylglycerol kinase catalytic region [Beutenbergia cavernae DSM 12333]|uniref:Diacylglycerol kinase catalytic region n=1 Tax=Beutenbergia cavernae (strain ATCC BAA-8 / DSM 12333 / CCUG 43141 / JCM 11478 / NBRC 16432 / NCIMB 13614 / HKI 0122) TaxID=471853 RepID=C5C6B1_BEUC1|nr:diacylglycerol kinase family protein [Beutenbergia cavernae]ACQ80317.1 diacylglycerol kinase catalytic region [Beutenbergia cavernae DSM 12333]
MSPRGGHDRPRRSGQRLGLLVNPVAGRGKARRAGRGVEELLAASGHSVVDLSGATPTEARHRAESAVGSGDVDALIVVGGDGVVNLGANAVLGHDPHVPLGIVPAGSGNDAARGLRIPVGDVEAAVGVLLAALHAPRAIDAVEVERPTVPGRRWYVGVLSAGFDAAVNERANRMRRLRGRARYAAAVLGELRRFRGYTFALEVDGARSELAGTLVSVANGTAIGGGMRIAPGADLTDGLLDVVTADRVSRRELLRIFPRVYAGTHVDHDAVHVVHARSVLLDVGPGVSPLAPPPIAHADGEPIGALPLRATVRPGALRVLA